MQIGIVEYGGDLSKTFQEIVSSKIAEASFKIQKALDVLDVLAFAKKLSNKDQLVVIVELNEERKEENRAFFEGLARLQVDTGKNIFKAIYYKDEGGEAAVKELAEAFVNYLFYPEKLEQRKEKKEGDFDWILKT